MNGKFWTWLRATKWPMFIVIVGFVSYRLFSPGIPVMSGPRVEPVAYAEGRTLFTHKWIPNDSLAQTGGDGLGPVFNATSCVACHNQGGIGGGGAEARNVQTFEVIVDAVGQKPVTGQVHARAVDPILLENDDIVTHLFSKRTIIFTTINSTSLFGEGWIDRIPDQAIRYQANKQSFKDTSTQLAGDFGNIPPGRVRILADGRIGRFGWKAQFATLEDFVAAACGNELGLGTPARQQSIPLGHVSTQVAPDLSQKQFSTLVSFVEGIPRPVQILPEDPQELVTAEHGKALFNSVGCAACHVADMGGIAGVYSDFLLHKISKPNLRVGASSADGGGGGGGGYGIAPPPPPPTQPTLPGSDDPKPDEWRTPPLWGVADSGPYMHDGTAPDLREAILAHGGAALVVTKRYKDMPLGDQDALIAFLSTLKAPANAEKIKAKAPADQLASKP